MVILKKPVRHVPLAVLPAVGLLDELKAGGLLREPAKGGTKFTVVGYGQTLDRSPPQLIGPDGLRRVAVSEYKALREGWLYLNQNFATGNGGTGWGDSGGPTFWKEPATGKEILVSLCSRGDPLCVANGVTWRVDTLDAGFHRLCVGHDGLDRTAEKAARWCHGRARSGTRRRRRGRLVFSLEVPSLRRRKLS